MHVHDVNMLIVPIYDGSDSYKVQSESNMVRSHLHDWLELKCGPKLTCRKGVPRGGKRMSNCIYVMLTC